MPKQIKVSEKDNQNAVRQFLELKGYRVFRLNNAPVPFKRGREIVYKKNIQTKGLPDLVAIHPIKKLIVFVECKNSSGGISSEEQKYFQKIADGCQTIAIIACKLSEIEEKLNLTIK